MDAGPVPPRGSGPVLFPRRTLVVAGIVGLLFIAGGFVATYLIQRFVTFPRPPPSAWNPGALQANAATDDATDLWPDIATDGEGTWMVAWSSGGRLPRHATR